MPEATLAFVLKQNLDTNKSDEAWARELLASRPFLASQIAIAREGLFQSLQFDHPDARPILHEILSHRAKRRWFLPHLTAHNVASIVLKATPQTAEAHAAICRAIDEPHLLDLLIDKATEQHDWESTHVQIPPPPRRNSAPGIEPA